MKLLNTFLKKISKQNFSKLYKSLGTFNLIASSLSNNDDIFNALYVLAFDEIPNTKFTVKESITRKSDAKEQLNLVEKHIIAKEVLKSFKDKDSVYDSELKNHVKVDANFKQPTDAFLVKIAKFGTTALVGNKCHLVNPLTNKVTAEYVDVKKEAAPTVPFADSDNEIVYENADYVITLNTMPTIPENIGDTAAFYTIKSNLGKGTRGGIVGQCVVVVNETGYALKGLKRYPEELEPSKLSEDTLMEAYSIVQKDYESRIADTNKYSAKEEENIEVKAEDEELKPGEQWATDEDMNHLMGWDVVEGNDYYQIYKHFEKNTYKIWDIDKKDWYDGQEINDLPTAEKIIENLAEGLPEKESAEKLSVEKKADEGVTAQDEKAQAVKQLTGEDAELTEWTTYGLPTYKSGDEEYAVASDEQEVYNAVVEEVESIFNDVGYDAFNWDNMGGIENFVDTKWFEEARQESNESYARDIAEYEPERFKEEAKEYGITVGEEIDEYAIDAFAEKMKENQEENPVEWFINNFGKDAIRDLIKENKITFDTHAIADEVINLDGAGHVLSGYDGNEVEQQVNGKTYFLYRQASKKSDKNIEKSALLQFVTIDATNKDEVKVIAGDKLIGTCKTIQAAFEKVADEEQEEPKTYTFDELSPEAKKVAIERAGNLYMDMFWDNLDEYITDFFNTNNEFSKYTIDFDTVDISATVPGGYNHAVGTASLKDGRLGTSFKNIIKPVVERVINDVAKESSYVSKHLNDYINLGLGDMYWDGDSFTPYQGFEVISDVPSGLSLQIAEALNEEAVPQIETALEEISNGITKYIENIEKYAYSEDYAMEDAQFNNERFYEDGHIAGYGVQAQEDRKAKTVKSKLLKTKQSEVKKEAEDNTEYHVEIYTKLNPDDNPEGFDAERYDHDYFQTLEEAKDWANKNTTDGKHYYEISLNDEIVESSEKDIDKKADEDEIRDFSKARVFEYQIIKGTDSDGPLYQVYMNISFDGDYLNRGNRLTIYYPKTDSFRHPNDRYPEENACVDDFAKKFIEENKEKLDTDGEVSIVTESYSKSNINKKADEELKQFDMKQELDGQKEFEQQDDFSQVSVPEEKEDTSEVNETMEAKPEAPKGESFSASEFGNNLAYIQQNNPDSFSKIMNNLKQLMVGDEKNIYNFLENWSKRNFQDFTAMTREDPTYSRHSQYQEQLKNNVLPKLKEMSEYKQAMEEKVSAEKGNVEASVREYDSSDPEDAAVYNHNGEDEGEED